MGSADKNIETARFISDLCSLRKEDFHVTGPIHMNNLRNFNLLKDYLDIEYGTSKLDMNLSRYKDLKNIRVLIMVPEAEIVKKELKLNDLIQRFFKKQGQVKWKQYLSKVFIKASFSFIYLFYISYLWENYKASLLVININQKEFPD